MSCAFEVTLNGQKVPINHQSPNITLLEFLRARGLTGAKEGCAEGDCGACSVVMLDRDASGRSAYRSINSCLVPLCLMAGREIVSVEGIGSPHPTSAGARSREKILHPVQQKMVELYGSQCGYCTPGFIMSSIEAYYRDDIRTYAQLEEQLCGNLCRCTGYRPIREAALQALIERHRKNGRDPLSERLHRPVARPGEAAYDFQAEKFFRPTSLKALFALRRRCPEGRLIAGATELGLDITKRFKRFPCLISLEAIPELKKIRATASHWHIGAAVTLTEIEERMAAEFPPLAAMLRVFGSRQIRNRATMGGNLVTASPIGDCAPVLLALDAEVILGSARGERRLPIRDFFVGYRRTALKPNEILTTILVPRFAQGRNGPRHWRWDKVSKRREMDISTVAACFCIDLDERRRIVNARLAYGGVAPIPARALQTETALLGKPWSFETVEDALPILLNEFTPISDVRGSALYRAGLVTDLFEKFFDETTHRQAQQTDSDRLPATVSSAASTRSGPPHESACLHVTGQAIFVDDRIDETKFLETWPVCSPHARAKIVRRDATAARQSPGIRAVLMAEDIPGRNDVGTKGDEPLLADQEVFYHGQIVALIVGDSQEACRTAAAKFVIQYQPLPALLTIQDAVAHSSYHNEPNYIRRGHVETGFARSPLILSSQFELGGQDHFYLETHAATAEPGEEGAMCIASSTQHPSEVQMVVAHILHQPIHKLVVQCPRMGGGFGGKETQAAIPAALAALAAQHTGSPVRVRFNRDQDMIITGHRHPFLATYQVGFDARGRFVAARIRLVSNGGWALDLSQAVTDRALFHLDNAYYLPIVEFSGQVARTNLASNTAFRGFGGPQGMLVIEEIIDCIARKLRLNPEVVRERNLYRGSGERNTTHYGQELEDNRLPLIWRQLKRSSDFDRRRREIARWNQTHERRKRGLAMTPVKFGISFTVTHLNQAGAFVLVYQDGTVQVNHGGTEMGQGVHTNILQVAATELGVLPDQIRVMPTSTDKVPNTSATAASCGTDLNGAAVRNACEIIRRRLAPLAVRMLSERAGKTVPARDLIFEANRIRSCRRPRAQISFAELIRKAYLERISLSATGYYATPGIHWDRQAGRGKPFHYFACGAAVCEVEVDGHTGMHQVRRVDILHDVGASINQGVNRGQIEGGFIQGMGWLTTEQLTWDKTGRLLTHSPDTYKIPSIGDTPRIFNVTLLNATGPTSAIYGSKAVGEPPLMLAISVREAIRDAIAAFYHRGEQVYLRSPATAEAIYSSIRLLFGNATARPWFRPPKTAARVSRQADLRVAILSKSVGP